MNKIKISTIIPIYNGEKYIKQCLDSIINQTLTDIEIICVNDGSTDNSLFILEKYATKDSRIKIINMNNYGAGVARNIGLKKAKGEYISFVDADDFIDLNTYELLYNYAKPNDLDMLFFQMVNYIESSGNLINTDLYDHKCFIDSLKKNVIFNYKDTKEQLFSIPVCAVSKIYKKEFLKENNLYFPEGILFEDNAFFYQSYFKAKKLGFIEKNLYKRRRHDSSLTQNINKRVFDIVPATNLVLNVFLKDNSLYDTYKKQVINHSFSMILEWFKKSPLELKEDFFHIAKTEFLGFTKLKNEFLDCLSENYLNIFNLFLSSKYYLDFIAEYKLSLVEYSSVIDSVKKDYKISVIIPIFNTGDIIHRTFMSIINQTIGYEDIEVIMVDDCSTDKTSEIIDEYAHKYDGFKAIHLKNNTGSPGTPRNVGIKEASADYIMFLDHDDFFEINAFETLYDEILKADQDLVFGNYNSITNGKLNNISFPNEKWGYFKDIGENERFVASPPPSIWTKLFKKELIIKNNILFPTILGEDAIFLSKVLLNAKGISYLGDSLIIMI